MLPLNVSFGIYAFLPMGWLFMAFIILSEAFLMSRYLVRKKFDKKIYLSATVSNIVSGALGIMTTMALNGGWWLVVWFPWVSSHEVDIHSRQEALALALYYLVALILSVLIELLANHLLLRKQYSFKKTLQATLIANAFSYILGAVLIILLCL
ncbi:MAG: hypothetical protein IJQ93_03740 [Bacteroidales bacterium]|nr:hypothetical protein [Bacteroidales bacterium]